MDCDAVRPADFFHVGEIMLVNHPADADARKSIAGNGPSCHAATPRR
jgi:hypothetical protein